MAAGLGFKTFVSGDVLSAADTNGYLMQGVLVFANAAARDAAITSPQEGQCCYLKDTNATQYYSGSAWVAIGGGGSPLTTKGDLYTYSTTDARLGVGTNGQVLAADSAEATGLKWTSPAAASSSWSLLGSSSATGASVTISFTAAYDALFILFDGLSSASAAAELQVQLGGITSANYFNFGMNIDGTGVNTLSPSGRANIPVAIMGSTAGSIVCGGIVVNGAINSGNKFGWVQGAANGTSSYGVVSNFRLNSSSTINSVKYFFDAGNIDAGTVSVYGSAVM
jgi:hypothetical protein